MTFQRTTGWRGYVIDGTGKAFGPNKRRWCRWHGFYLHQYIEVPKGRIAYCNNNCAHEYRVRNEPAYVRECLVARDHQVCAACGLDCDAIKRAFDALPWRSRDIPADQWCREDAARALKRQGLDIRGHLWEADHVVPVIEGGGECGLDGYRTLCVVCHRAETRDLAGRRAMARRIERYGAVQVPLGIGA